MTNEPEIVEAVTETAEVVSKATGNKLNKVIGFSVLGLATAGTVVAVIFTVKYFKKRKQKKLEAMADDFDDDDELDDLSIEIEGSEEKDSE